MARFATHEECLMMKEGWGCTGGIEMFDKKGNISCGPNCPFKKTEEEQLAIEKRILTRFQNNEGTPIRPFVSRVTGEVLFNPESDIPRRHMY